LQTNLLNYLLIAIYPDFVKKSLSTSVRANVKSTNVICPHNGTHDLSIFAIFSKTGFVDLCAANHQHCALKEYNINILIFCVIYVMFFLILVIHCVPNKKNM